MSACTCGHEPRAHDHYTRSTSCGLCDCQAYVRPWGRRKFVLVWICVLAGFLAFWGGVVAAGVVVA